MGSRMRRKFDVNRRMFASMKVGVQIIPKCDAESIPFQVGQFAEPRDRFSYITALENPNATAKMLLGPTRWLKIRVFFCFWIVVLGVLLLAMAVFFVLQVKNEAF